MAFATAQVRLDRQRPIEANLEIAVPHTGRRLGAREHDVECLAVAGGSEFINAEGLPHPRPLSVSMEERFQLIGGNSADQEVVVDRVRVAQKPIAHGTADAVEFAGGQDCLLPRREGHAASCAARPRIG